MKRLDMVAEWLYKDSETYITKYQQGGYLIVYRPNIDKYLYSGKITIKVKNKPRTATIKKLLIKEIKNRALDFGWYRNGLKRLISSIHYKEYYVVDDFTKIKIVFKGYTYESKELVGIFNDYTEALAKKCGF